MKRFPSDVSKLKLQYPLFRNTKHFSLNGLASNVVVLCKATATFDNKEIIVIEPFKDHLGDNLVNLNPVDTFYDLEDSSFKMKGYFLLKKNYQTIFSHHLSSLKIIIVLSSN